MKVFPRHHAVKHLGATAPTRSCASGAPAIRAVEVVSLVAMLIAVFVIGRSPQLAMRSRDEWPRSTRAETQTELATNR